MSINENTALLHNHTILYITVPKENSGYETNFCDDNYSFGLTLEELLPYKDDPWWQNLRNALFYIICLVFIFFLISACMLAYTHGGSSYCKILSLEAISTIGSTMASDVLSTSSLISP